MSRVKSDRLKKGSIFIPLIFSFGAKLEELPLEAFVQDPTKVSNALRTIQSYFETDGVFTYGDEQLLPEALASLWGDAATVKEGRAFDPDRTGEVESQMGAILQQGRLATAIEVTKRLNILLPDTLLAGFFAGPATLAARLSGLPAGDALLHPKLISLAAKAALAYTRALGDTGIDILVISEDSLPPVNENISRALTRIYSPIWNTAKYYGFTALLAIKEFSGQDVGTLRRIVDGLVIPANAEPEVRQNFKKVSFSMPVSIFQMPPAEITAYLGQTGIAAAAQCSNLFLLTTDGEIPATVHKESMIRGIVTIRDHLRGV